MRLSAARLCDKCRCYIAKQKKNAKLTALGVYLVVACRTRR